MPKLILFAAVVAIGLAAGYVSGEMVRVRIREYEDMRKDLKSAHGKIKLERICLERLIDFLCEHGSVKHFWNALKRDNGRTRASDTGLAADALLVSDDDKAEIVAYFASFGNSDTEGELQKLEHLMERLGLSEEKLKKDSAEKIKLRSSLFLLAGLAVGLMLL